MLNSFCFLLKDAQKPKKTAYKNTLIAYLQGYVGQFHSLRPIIANVQGFPMPGKTTGWKLKAAT